MAASEHDSLSSSPSSSPSPASATSIAPRLKLCYLNHAKLFSLPPSPITFSKLLSLVAQAFPETSHHSSASPPIELSYCDEDGDTVIIDSEESLSLAALSLQKTHLDVIKLQIRVKNDVSNTFGSSNAANDRRPRPRIPCRHFQAGRCRYGSACQFLHDTADHRNLTQPNSTSRIPCRHFQAGLCRYGSACQFLHDTADRRNLTQPNSTSRNLLTQPNGATRNLMQPNRGIRNLTQHNALSDEFEIDEWFVNLKNASEHDNISYLTSHEGFESFLHVLNHPCLAQADLHQIVSVLTRPKLRMSLLKQDTDKIFNALIGSQFLNVLHSHIRTSVKPILGCIEPYLFLCEELMSRTSDGWKEVPLDELRTLVDELKSDSDSVIDVGYSLARLLDHRAKKKRLEAVDETMERLNLGSNFRDLPIIPLKEQLLSRENPSPLPVNQVGLRYPNVGVYLDTHFRLMQEDCISTLRDGIHELRENSRGDPNIHVYTDVRLAGLQCGNNGMVFRVCFNAYVRRPIDWQSAKRLMFGSLLCMSCDKFQTLLWAVVANRTVEQLTKSMVDIQLLESSEQKALEASNIYVMAESSAAYFEAYSHVLKNLQREEMDDLPFQEQLIALEPLVKEPAYLKERNREDVFDFECAFPEMKIELPTTQFHILQIWPEWKNSLDKSQMSALKHGLTKRLALIQGPPGTGKTFIGLLIVRIMLTNLKHLPEKIDRGFGRLNTLLPQKVQEEDTVGGPILVICYTNHALDQFLEGIFAHENSVVRVGGRSKSPTLEACNLQKLLHEGSWNFGLSAYLHVEKTKAYTRKKELEEQIVECANLVNMVYVTEKTLHGIATEEQVRSLFYEGCDISRVVRMWLHESEKDNRTANKGESSFSKRQEATSSMQNPFEALATMGPLDGQAENSGQIKVVGDSGDLGMRERALVPHAAAGKSGQTKVLDDSGGLYVKDGDTLHSYAGHVCQSQSSKMVQSLLKDDTQEVDEVEAMDNIRMQKGKQQVGWRSDSSPTSSIAEDYRHGDLVYADAEGNVTDIFAEMLKSTKSTGEDDMKMITPRRNEKVEGNPADSTWTEIKARRPKPYVPPGKRSNEGKGKNEEFQAESLEVSKNQADVWSLSGEARSALHVHWLDAIHYQAQEQINRFSIEYAETCQKKQEIENELQLSVLRKAKVVGMTTTAAARNHTILESLQAEIIVVEEAAEVLESHILACLTPSTKHLVLIGDHLQLRPTVAIHKLAVKHQLDVSLFERLVKSGVEYVTLQVQRRMRPSISKLISGIYPMLKDHESVISRENIRGIKTNVFFLHHTTAEEHRGDDELGKVNVVEAQLVVELCVYLVKQQYAYTDITILSMYKGQTQEIIRRLSQKLHAKDDEKLPRVSSVDDYQGEECKIIILSLVRSNCLPTAGGPGKIGFLAVSNRVCVALSRARDGLFMFGNGDLLSKKSELWEGVVKDLQQSNSYGDALVLTCQNHPDREIKIQKPSDFGNAPDGGCEKACEHQLSCGHACPKHCHPGGHEKIVCPKRCPRQLPLCGHQCQSICHGFDDCPPCRHLVVKELPQCGHSARVHCSTNIESVSCQTPCPKILKCSHNCTRKCGQTCTPLCKELVVKILPCGHSTKLACHVDSLDYLCQQPCRQILTDCEHICQGTCGSCKQGQAHVPCEQKCNRSMPCGHPCSSQCHEVCPPCSMPCQKRCLHSRCPKTCGYPCVPCMEPCQWKCRHQACKLLCHELCSRPSCSEPCENILQCGHPCLGFCGELCPNICRFCTPGFKDTISLLMMDEFDELDRFVMLQDCGHVFEVSGLDTWIHTEQCGAGVNSVSPKQCPECKSPITRSLRYGNQVKAKLHQIEEVKKLILEYDIIYQGIKLLQLKQYDRAVEKFVAAIEGNQANFEAYLRLGSALCLQLQFKEGIHFFQFVVQHSPLRNAVNEINAGQAHSIENLSVKMLKLKNLIQTTALCQPLIDREAEKKLAVRALVEWANALSNMRKFAAATKACEVVLKEEPGHKEAEETLKLLKEEKRIEMEVVEVMMKEVGRRGHWYQCPNGHYYVVGECGGPMQVSKCPDCKVTVGGQNHAPADGNRHASIDGSSHSAWSNRTGLGI